MPEAAEETFGGSDNPQLKKQMNSEDVDRWGGGVDSPANTHLLYFTFHSPKLPSPEQAHTYVT